jgi:thiol-disulfide isomerase/thioredoxin
MVPGLSIHYLILWSVVLFQLLLVAAVLRELRDIKQSIEAGRAASDTLPTGSLAPAFDGQDSRTGITLSSGRFRGVGGVLFFFSSTCPTCRHLASVLKKIKPEELPVIVFCQGEAQACARLTERLGDVAPVLLSETDKVAASYRIPGFPAAVVIDRSSRIVSYAYPQNAEDMRDIFLKSMPAVSDAAQAGNVLVGDSR